MLTRYFHDINTRSFTDYLGLFSSDIRAHTDPQQLASGYRSTYDTDAELLALHRSDDGRPMAVLAFTSHQDAQDGPNGLTCTRWLIHLYLEPGPEAGGYVFGTAPPSYHARFSSC
jgi:hypothetical protein